VNRQRRANFFSTYKYRSNLPLPNFLSHIHLHERTLTLAKSSTMPPNRWHDWTGQQVDYLCCLKNHTTLSYLKISEIFAARLDVILSGDILRYKCNLLKGTLAPSQVNRRVSEVGGSSAWYVLFISYLLSLSETPYRELASSRK